MMNLHVCAVEDGLINTTADVIVIGSGFGGAVAACLVLRAAAGDLRMGVNVDGNQIVAVHTGALLKND